MQTTSFDSLLKLDATYRAVTREIDREFRKLRAQAIANAKAAAAARRLKIGGGK